MSTPENSAFGASGWWEEGGTHALLHAVNPTRLRYLRERCGELAGKSVVDVGCGGGILSLALASAGAEVTGIDVSAGVLEAARSEAKHQALPAEFIETDAASFKASGSGGFDLVVCMEMLEHVADPAGEIEALAELARPGADVVVSTINRTFAARCAMIWGMENILDALPRGTHKHEDFLRPSEVAGWCAQSGLDVLDVAGLNWSFFGKTFLLSRTQMPINYLLHARKADHG